MGRSLSRPLLVAVGAVLVLAGGAFAYTHFAPRSSGRLNIETADAVKGDVRRIVSTSGTVKALVTVDVGSQLSGQISELPADFNTVVKAGDVIARLDPQTYETRVREAEAALVVAQSQVEVQQANVARAQANLRRMEAEFARAEELKARGTASQASYDTALANVEGARADLQVAQAGLVNAEATLQQRQASLDTAKIDLERTEIRSPIDGIVVSRVVNVGQTVAASMQTPVLFTIAGDLTRVQIEAQVDEADIGQVQQGQIVSFTVDAFPDSQFRGGVEQIRLAALSEANVVTYTVVIGAMNPGQRLLPGMTANVDIVTGESEDVLTVDNRALRYEPRGGAESLLTGEGRTELARLKEAEDNQGGFPRFAGGPPFPPGGFQGPPGGGFGPPGAQGGAPGGFRGGMVGRMREELDLTDAQVEQIQTAMRASFQSLQQPAGGAQSPPDPSAFRMRIAAAMEPVLTPEQLEKFRAIQAEMELNDRSTVWVLTASGQLAPRRIALGVADSSVTEVIDGDLKEGEKVVVRVREAST